jgi:hypothetical protein
MGMSKMDYATLLDDIGTKIVAISKSLKDNSLIEECENIEQLSTHFNNLKDSLRNFVECRNMASIIVPPDNIKEEHGILIDSFDNYLEGTRQQIQSISLQPMAINLELYRSGLTNQTIGEMRTLDAVNQIVNKFSK